MIKLKPNHPDFNAVEYAIRATTKDKIRPVYNHLYVDDLGGHLVVVGCDAHRLHYAPTESLELGYYEIIKNTKKEIIIAKINFDGEFPQWKAIIPEKSETFVTLSRSDKIGNCNILFPIYSKGIKANANYLIDAVRFESHAYIPENNTSPFLIEDIHNSDFNAIVMPMAQ